MIQLKNVTIRRGRKLLLDEADLSLFDREKVGIVGANGVGKSTLYQCFLRNISVDGGDIDMTSKLLLAHLKQETPSCETTAIDYALEGDVEYTEVKAEMDSAEDGMAIAHANAHFAEIDGYTAATRAAIILKGLGFTQEQLHNSVSSFSGGWRMRLNLAQVLLSRADIMLLDEPTNHLDLEGIFWLSEWVKSVDSLVIVISHDREFLDDFTTHVVHFIDHQLKKYTGNFSSFEKEYAEQLSLQKAAYSKQQAKRAHLQKFVDRFRAKASKAKQAQSRVKMLDKMQQVAQVHDKSPFKFKFEDIPLVANPVLSVDQVDVGYNEKAVLSDLNFNIINGDRIGLLGLNGAGKSTLVKLLGGDLSPMNGKMNCSNKVKIGYFAQHQLDQLDSTSDLLTHLYRLDKTIPESQARQFLGGFNFQGDQVFDKVGSLSGGEKARLVLALLVWQKPHLLLLDEPTNHLDMEMREALVQALLTYQGALILVSHDRYLLNCLVDEFWLVDRTDVTPFKGDLNDYRKMLKDREREESKGKKQKKLKLESLEKQLEKLEKKLIKLKEQLDPLEEKLSDPTLYLPENKEKLSNIQTEHDQLKNKINTLDKEMTTLLESNL